MQEQASAELDKLVKRFQEAGLPAERHTISKYSGFAALGAQETDVESVEVYLGPSPGKPGYQSYAVAQTFLPKYPNLALTFLLELADEDRKPSNTPARFGIDVDKKFSTIFLPIMHSALNPLDPTGRQRSLLMQSYNAEMTLPDFVQASYYSTKLLMRFKRDGQLALIAVDYYDRLSRIIAGALRSLGQLLPDIHLIPRTATASSLVIPIPDKRGGYHEIKNSSTALDEGFRLAQAYLDAHYEPQIKL